MNKATLVLAMAATVALGQDFPAGDSVTNPVAQSADGSALQPDPTEPIKRTLRSLGQDFPAAYETNKRAGTISCVVQCPGTNDLETVWQALRVGVQDKVRISRGASSVTVVIRSLEARPPDVSPQIRLAVRAHSEAARLRNDAALKRVLAQRKKDQAFQLEVQSNRLGSRAFDVGTPFDYTVDGLERRADELEKLSDRIEARGGRISPAESQTYTMAKGDAFLIQNAADRLESDMLSLKHQAEALHREANALLQEAAELERQAALLERPRR